ncbi:hypothetical protein DLM77_18605 [Leptospira yasudae]|uniref:Uncharacterized protein n=1 Tax=Leptospira yasudae TaxID=2202201 RepID=A0ABX9LYT1_9LEPT|nr:hypothetical protein DLM77_18605 [Leptospira yasudae]
MDEPRERCLGAKSSMDARLRRGKSKVATRKEQLTEFRKRCETGSRAALRRAYASEAGVPSEGEANPP